MKIGKTILRSQLNGIKLKNFLHNPLNLGFVHFCALPAGRKALMRNFNSQEGMFKPILRTKITPEGLPIQQSGHKNVQSRDLCE
jgi:hypothetical protein